MPGPLGSVCRASLTVRLACASPWRSGMGDRPQTLRPTRHLRAHGTVHALIHIELSIARHAGAGSPKKKIQRTLAERRSWLWARLDDARRKTKEKTLAGELVQLSERFTIEGEAIARGDREQRKAQLGTQLGSRELQKHATIINPNQTHNNKPDTDPRIKKIVVPF